MHVFWNENVISYNLTIITRIFSAYKIDRKIRIFSLGLKNNIFIHKKESIWSYHVCCDRTFVPKRVHFFFTSCKKTAGKSRGLLIEPVAEPGEGPPRPPLFLKQTEARRAKKYFLETGVPLISGSGWPPPPPLPLSEGLDPHLNFHKMIIGDRSSFRSVTGALCTKRAECGSSWLKKSGSRYAVRCTSPILFLGSYVSSTQSDPITIIHCRISCFCFSAVVLAKETVNPDVNSF